LSSPTASASLGEGGRGAGRGSGRGAAARWGAGAGFRARGLLKGPVGRCTGRLAAGSRPGRSPAPAPPPGPPAPHCSHLWRRRGALLEWPVEERHLLGPVIRLHLGRSRPLALRQELVKLGVAQAVDDVAGRRAGAGERGCRGAGVGAARGRGGAVGGRVGAAAAAERGSVPPRPLCLASTPSFPPTQPPDSRRVRSGHMTGL
jgi:hypothetical protein